MSASVSANELVQLGLNPAAAEALASQVNDALQIADPGVRWRRVSREILRPDQPPDVHRFLFERSFADWNESHGPRPAWTPDDSDIQQANATRWMRLLGIDTFAALHAWSAREREAFWSKVIEVLPIRLRRPWEKMVDLSAGISSPRWLVGARLNIAESCFQAAPDTVAIVFQREDGAIERLTVRELDSLSNRVARGLVKEGFRPGDALAIAMPMTAESVAIYLGIVKAGCVVVSIADSFGAKEIATRIRLGNARAVFTQDVNRRGSKLLPLYEKITACAAPPAIVVAEGERLSLPLRGEDRSWHDFLDDHDQFEAVECEAGAPMNILFSSGTTGDPKAIPWTHTTPVKCAADGHFHQDIQPGDVVAWPTNLGWMMGPWLIFASLVNRATMALYYGAPTGSAFGRFVQDAGVTTLGVVPSLVRTWRSTECMPGLDWSRIKLFTSTGEASNADDMLWLMARAGYRPVIEYCGGTEIAGGYIAGTILRPCSPATFNTLAMGLDAVILDEEGRPCDNGELFLIPPSIGMSTELLNRDHDEVYFTGTPTGPAGELLRRHGDQIERLPDGFYRAHGRMDDTMNLGGIKVGSAEIERTLNTLAELEETAAVAVPRPGGGPSQLVVFAVPATGSTIDVVALKKLMQRAIDRELNPLFKIYDVVSCERLPRTASNKVMRRTLRKQYNASS